MDTVDECCGGESNRRSGLRADWYACRPIVEELHKGMKTGCGIETMQFEKIERWSGDRSALGSDDDAVASA